MGKNDSIGDLTVIKGEPWDTSAGTKQTPLRNFESTETVIVVTRRLATVTALTVPDFNED